MVFSKPVPPELEAMQAVAAARRDARHVLADWSARLGAVMRELRGLSELRPLQVPDSGIRLSGRHGFKLQPGGAVAGDDPHRKFFVHLEDCADFVIDGLALRRGRNAVFLHGCRRFRIADVDLADLEGYGVILFDCSEFVVEGVRSRNLLCSAVMAVGDTSLGSIRRVRARDGRGFLNCDAGGVVLLHCTDRVSPEDIPERCHEARSILDNSPLTKCRRVSGNTKYCVM